MKLKILKLGGTLFEGEANSINMPTEMGEITVLPGHIPLVTHLQKGVVHIKSSTGDNDFPIISGFAEIKADEVTVLVD